jgi:hypothetical protein
MMYSSFCAMPASLRETRRQWQAIARSALTEQMVHCAGLFGGLRLQRRNGIRNANVIGPVIPAIRAVHVRLPRCACGRDRHRERLQDVSCRRVLGKRNHR